MSCRAGFVIAGTVVIGAAALAYRAAKSVFAPVARELSTYARIVADAARQNGAALVDAMKGEFAALADEWAPSLRSATVRNAAAGKIVGALGLILPMLHVQLDDVARLLMVGAIVWTFLRVIRMRMRAGPPTVQQQPAMGPGAAGGACDNTQPEQLAMTFDGPPPADRVARRAPRTFDDAPAQSIVQAAVAAVRAEGRVRPYAKK